MSCSRSVVLLNNALKIAVMKNGDLSLIQLGLDKEKREITESVIAIYQNELNLLSDVVNLLVKRAVFLQANLLRGRTDEINDRNCQLLR